MCKRTAIAILALIVLAMFSLVSCGGSEAKSVYKPPAEVFDVKISGTSEPEIDGVRFTYDSKTRIDTVTFTVDGHEYKQQYSYDDPAQIVIKTIYQTEVVEEKVIRYVDIPVESGYTVVDGYYLYITDDMPVEDNGSVTNNNGSNNDAPQQNNTNWKQLYSDYLADFMSRDDLYISQFKDVLIYSLIYVDNDDIPELFISGTSHTVWAGSVLCWIKSDNVNEKDSMGAITYIEKSGLLHKNNGWTGRVYDVVFKLDDNGITEIAHGDVSVPDNRYTWEGVNGSESEYNNKLNAVFDTTREKSATKTTYSFDQIMDILS